MDSPSATEAGVRLDGVSKHFDGGDVVAVDDISLDIGAGELHVLLGPSGCGKSTLLRMVAGLERPTSGTIHIAGRVVNDVAPKARDVAMGVPELRLYPHKTVFKNIEFPLKARGVDRAARAEAVASAAGILGLDGLLDESRERSPAASASGWRSPGRSCGSRRCS